jgi:propionate CoA-transferase
MAANQEIEAFTLPQGCLSQLMRDIAGGRPGLLTKVGLGTFVDPRLGGGSQGRQTDSQLVEIVQIPGVGEHLLYRSMRFDVAFLRGTTADELGNISMEDEPLYGESLSMAQGAKRTGGIVIVEVKRVVSARGISAKLVRIPGFLVDYVVVDPAQRQTYATPFRVGYSGQYREPLAPFADSDLDVRKVIARRAALELHRGAVCNIGAGVSTAIPIVLAEEGLTDWVIMTNEQGLNGGLPMGGRDTGAALNCDCMVDQPYQFDFYDGGGLDFAFLSFGEVGRDGSVNVSRLAGRVIGIGGFVNISQGARKVVFSGTFTTRGLEVGISDAGLTIEKEGSIRRFCRTVDQVSFAGPRAFAMGQEVLYVTERAVFRLGANGLVLIEVAPGVDIEKQVLAEMEFAPEVAPDLRRMDPRVFGSEPMGLGSRNLDAGDAIETA